MVRWSPEQEIEHKEVPVAEWNVEHVKNWVKSLQNFDAYIDRFDFTDGRALISLDAAALMTMGIPANAAVPLATHIQRLCPSPSAIDLSKVLQNMGFNLLSASACRSIIESK
eukprot:TRINITY_DN6627_c0_g1_i5.p1 TRINITY_DN6627_c0_g1~~TRINITY_DN6627_c0_g1_i5.p1  ORF type:complete len:112 (-),score=9.94 TRINITY_DN6627_c0_g1_i5:241-576(-)